MIIYCFKADTHSYKFFPGIKNIQNLGQNIGTGNSAVMLSLSDELLFVWKPFDLLMS